MFIGSRDELVKGGETKTSEKETRTTGCWEKF